MGPRKAFRAENGLVGSPRRPDRGTGRVGCSPEFNENRAKNQPVAASLIVNELPITVEQVLEAAGIEPASMFE